jgi:putative transposase
MAFNLHTQRRRSLRIPDYDYSQGGYYFVTLCSYNRDCLFGEITGEEIILNDIGKTVIECWEDIPSHFSYASLDAYIVMPNHIHGIITISENERASHDLPLQARHKSGSSPGSITAIVGLFKSSVTRRINGQRPGLPPMKIWQRNYYEHVIRDEAELNSIREYILYNVVKWAEDGNNPAKFGNQA